MSPGIILIKKKTKAPAPKIVGAIDIMRLMTKFLKKKPNYIYVTFMLRFNIYLYSNTLRQPCTILAPMDT